MRIVHLLWSMNLKDGGVVRALLDLCPLLASAGHDVTLLTSLDSDVPDAWKVHQACGVPRCVKLPMPGPAFRYGKRALDIMRAEIAAADVLHLHGMWMMCNDQAARLCRKLGTPYVWSIHGMLDDWCMSQSALKKRIYLALGGSANLSRAAVIHCTAQAELQQAGKWFPHEKGVVASLPFDLSDYQNLPGPDLARTQFSLPTPGAPAHQPVILFLSRLDRKKGLEPLIRSIARLRDEGTRAKLVIAGGGEETYVQSLHTLVDQLALKDETLFAGFVKGQLKTSLYQAADAFVLPSSQENFGYVVVEALASLTPVITTRGVALWPDLERERAATLVEPTVEALTAAIRSAIADPAAARASAARGRAWCMNQFNPASIIAGFNTLYTRATRTRGQA